MPPLAAADAPKAAARRHPEWVAWERRWRWLLDSYVGGDRYRRAVYGRDRAGAPIRNLVRHKREYPTDRQLDGGGYWPADGAGPADPTSDDYALRLERTPVPDFVAEVVRKHVGKVYAREVDRSGPPAYEAWIADVDGMGTDVDTWMRCEVAPLLKVYGCLDVLCDHPPAPEGEPVATRADASRLGLDRVVARVVHPADVVSWRLVPGGVDYAEATVRERVEIRDERSGEPREVDQYRRWDLDSWTLVREGRVVASGDHPYRRVPMVRLFHRRHPACRHVGLSPVEPIAEAMREYYNRDSELILSDTIQAHPVLQGPEDCLDGQGQLDVGPGFLLLKKKSMSGGSPTYEGFEPVDFPKGGAESIRENKRDLRDGIDRSAALAKPAGAVGGSTVAQSGVSKSYDHADLADLLSDDAEIYAAAERRIGALVLDVASDGASTGTTPPPIEVVYSHQFDLIDAETAAAGLADLQDAVERSGRLPSAEAPLIFAQVKRLLVGESEETYAAIWAEVQAVVAARGEERRRAAERLGGRVADGGPDDEEDDPEGLSETDDEDDDAPADES